MSFGSGWGIDMRNDHEILGVSAGADQKEIKKAYFKLVRQYSPEKDPERFQEIRGAYERLIQENDSEKEELRLSMEMPDEPFAHSMLRQITELERQQDYEGAAATAKEAISRFGEYEVFLYELASSQLHDGHSGNAVKNFEKLVGRFPEKTVYKRELAISYFDRGYGKKAFQAFEEAYAAGVRDNDFILQFSLCCRDRDEESRGIEILLEMVKGYDNSAKAKAEVEDYLEAYTGIFALCFFASADENNELLELYCGFLRAAGRALKDCSEMVIEMTLFLVKFFNNPKCLAGLNAVLAATKKILPERSYPDEWKSISESFLEARIQADDRLDEVWLGCYEAYFEADYIYDDSIIRFMKLDMKLILLERRDELKSQFGIVMAEYPELYERMKDFYELLEQENLPYIMEKMRKEYGSLNRNISGGRYYELYPQYRLSEEKLQWDSAENGSYMRSDKKVGRNDPCPCGSGKKYKKCCGR